MFLLVKAINKLKAATVKAEEKAEEIQQQREEERMERKRIANETERRMGMVVWFTIILFGAVGFLRAIFR